MNSATEELLKIISDFDDLFKGAYNIREDGGCAGRRSTENIKIENKEDAPGLVINVKPGTKGENVYIPACVTKGNIKDLVYNDFYIGEGADVTVIAGCGVHSDEEEESLHNGIHRFFLEKNSKVLYKENHVGTGDSLGIRKIDPITEIYLNDGAQLEIDTVQLGGVSSSIRKTTATLGSRSKLIVRERIMTDGNEYASTDFYVTLNGEDSGVNLISRSVAKGDSVQEFKSDIIGNVRCTGHSECDAILMDNGRVTASPSLTASHIDASLIHEAAIGKIAGEQILKLCTLGLTEKEAEETIISGFLK